jgi:hypothetical protein
VFATEPLALKFVFRSFSKSTGRAAAARGTAFQHGIHTSVKIGLAAALLTIDVKVAAEEG